MDGDSIDIAGLLAQLGPRDVLLVDEAHALGVVGSEGAGLAREIDDPRLLVMGTLSKSFGSMGGFVAGPAVAVDLLVNRARSFIYDTALPPALALAARVALTIIRKAEDRRATLRDNVTHLREGLHYLGLPAIDTPSPVVPVVLGSEERTLRIADQLLAKRIEAPAIRPPTVPDGASRLRFSLRSNLSREQVDVAVGELSRCIGTL
jgi:8-amino-7-oxononanoate synthase